MHDFKAAAKRKKKAKRKGPIEDLMESLRQRIRELNAEIAVRDNMGDEVMRILREATGKRDFHSEMEAAKYAAEIIRASGWTPISGAPKGQILVFVGRWNSGWWQWKETWFAGQAMEDGYTHYLPEPAPPAREVANDGE